MIVDLHTHTTVSSPCSLIDPEDLIIRAMTIGLEAVCVTEHSQIRGAEVAARLGCKHGFPVFKGLEASTNRGDMLVFGWEKDVERGISFKALLEMVQSVGGVVIPAHPYRGYYGFRGLKTESIDDEVLKSVVAIETYNGINQPAMNEEAERIRAEYGLLGTGGSDAHSVEMVGRCVTIFEKFIDNEAELIGELKRGKYRADYYY